jgi:hypothetical protein
MWYIGFPTRMMFKNAHFAVGPGSHGRGFSIGSLRLALSILAITAATAPLAAQTAKGLRVVPVVRGETVDVKFELREGLTPDVRAAIDSGLKTIFTYTVELKVDAGWWLDRTIATAVVTNSVEYDNLRRQHTLERRVDGRNEQSQTTEDQEVVRQWMTNVDYLPLFKTKILQRNREYYVRVSAVARPSYGSILWPFGSGTSAQTKFVFFR